MKIQKGIALPGKEPMTVEQMQQKTLGKIHQVAEGYEKHFLREMMKAMRSTVTESGFINVNQGEKIFREQLDDEYVEKWGAKGGIGLASLIENQIVEKYGVQMGLRSAVAKPQGPIKLDKSAMFMAHEVAPAPRAAIKIERQASENKEQVPVTSPWSGTVIDARKVGESDSLLTIEHDNGLKSRMAFKGELTKDLTGKSVEAGEAVGYLVENSKELYWNLAPGPGPKPASALTDDHSGPKVSVSE